MSRIKFTFKIPDVLKKFTDRFDKIVLNNKSISISVTTAIPSIEEIQNVFFAIRNEIRGAMDYSLNLFILHFLGLRNVKYDSIIEGIILQYFEKLYQYQDKEVGKYAECLFKEKGQILVFGKDKYTLNDSISLDLLKVKEDFMKLTQLTHCTVDEFNSPASFDIKKGLVIGKINENKNMLEFLKVMKEMVLRNTKPNSLNDIRLINAGMSQQTIDQLCAVASILDISINLFKYNFNRQWNPIKIGTSINSIREINILLPLLKGSKFDNDSTVKILYSREECICSLAKMYQQSKELQNEVINLNIQEPSAGYSNELLKYVTLIGKEESVSYWKTKITQAGNMSIIGAYKYVGQPLTHSTII